MAILVLVATIKKTGITVNKAPYAVVDTELGGHACIFPKKEHAKASKTLEKLQAGKTYSLSGIGIAKGGVYVYDTTKIVEVA